MLIDLKREVKDSRDFHFLEAVVGSLVGQRCVSVEMSYGGELMLHVGEPVPYSHPKLAGEKKGTWILGTRASWWNFLLTDPPYLILPNGTPESSGAASWQTVTAEEIESKAAQLIGRPVVFAAPTLYPLRGAPCLGVALFIGFGNGSRLAIMPNDDSDEEPLLADWELFTPFAMYLRCGPGPVWSYVRSDVVEADKADHGTLPQTAGPA
jgi:hypothetical protein